MSRLLPDFLRPPLAEVVLGVQFEPLPGFKSLHSGLYWQRIRSQFPQVEERSPLQPVIERFGGKPPRDLKIQWEVHETPSPSRYWFLNEVGDQLIQLQPDRFLHNWRKRGVEDSYPRYESIRQVFQEELERFQVFLADEDLGEVKANQCELTYVNHITRDGVWSGHGQLDRVLTRVSGPAAGDFLGEPEDGRLALRFVILDGDERPRGRLHVVTRSGFRSSDGEPLTILELTARGQPLREGVEGVLAFLDLGREWIVRGFDSITTPAMHKLWGRSDA